VRVRLALCGVALVATVSGCTSSPAASPTPAASGGTPAGGAAAGVAPGGSAPAWTEPAKYGFVLDRQCGSGPSLGRYRVAVAGGQVVTADRIDGKTAAGEEEIDVPTLREMLDLAQTAADDGGEVSTTVDPADGHPITVSIDVSDGGTDGETDGGRSCFTVSDYAPAV
jgi:hypothetical protein